MQMIKQTLAGLAVGEPCQFQNLVMFPLIGPEAIAALYLTLDEALESKQSRVTEVSEAGSVPELSFENLTEQKVLLLDGEELVGAKQNRVLNLTILVGGQMKIVIPVSCVEHGRWHRTSREFGTARRAMFSSGRAEKMADVSVSMADYGTRRSDQGAVWDSIAAKSARMGVHSETGAAGEIHEKNRLRIKDYVENIKAANHQVGAVFSVNGEVCGLELFDSPRIFSKVMPKLIESYALDALDVHRPDKTMPPAEVVNRFLGHVAEAEEKRFKALGEGEDVRLEGPTVVGAALEADNHLVHLSAFCLKSKRPIKKSSLRLRA